MWHGTDRLRIGWWLWVQTAAAVVGLGIRPAMVHAQPVCQADQLVEFVASDSAAGDHFGTAVALGDGIAAVGAPLCDDSAMGNMGAVYVYRDVGTTWVETKLTASDGVDDDEFGAAVALDGEILIVGAPGANAAYVLIDDDGEWQEVQKLQPGQVAVGDEFGCAVALQGDRAVIGARSADVAGINSGAAYVFRREGGVWMPQSVLIGSDSTQIDYFGGAVDISDGRLIVGAGYNDENGSNAGAAYVFRDDPGQCAGPACPWVEESKLIAVPEAGDNFTGDLFGYSVALWGNVSVVGARKHSHSGMTHAGAVYVFRRQGWAWYQESKLTPSDADALDQFGYAVDIEGDVVVAGAKAADIGYWPAAGAIYSYHFDGDDWQEEAKLVDSEAYWDDWLGTSVAIRGSMVLAGAEGTDLYENGGYFSGSAFLFQASCGVFSCPAEISGDGVVNEIDLALFLGAWTDGDVSVADLNADGVIDHRDLSLLLSDWGPC